MVNSSATPITSKEYNFCSPSARQEVSKLFLQETTFLLVWLYDLATEIFPADGTHESVSTVWLQYWPHIVGVVHPSTVMLALKAYAGPRTICNYQSSSYSLNFQMIALFMIWYQDSSLRKWNKVDWKKLKEKNSAIFKVYNTMTPW